MTSPGSAKRMSKTEAAQIVADNIAAYCSEHDIDDGEITNTMIAEAMSRMEFQTQSGSYSHRAALMRPSVRTVRIAYRRNAGLI